MAAVVSPGTTAHATIFDTAKPPPPPEVFAARHDAAALAAAADADAVSAFRDLGFGTLRRHIDAEGVTAAVAELVSSRDAAKLLSEAASRFKAIPFDALYEEDLATSTGGASGQPPLHERDEGLSLGQCDRMLSSATRGATTRR